MCQGGAGATNLSAALVYFMSIEDDAELVGRCLRGDAQAFAVAKDRDSSAKVLITFPA